MTRTAIVTVSFVSIALNGAPVSAETPADVAKTISTFEMTKGAFAPTWGSLEKYKPPKWFRDAKFGMWAIIGPQCVPLQGDWYARHMYIQGHRQNRHHIKTYGHPGKFGYKDLIAKFNPRKLDYDKLVGLYKQAGAKYAVILAVHHDNFDLWDSRHHDWDSVEKGPRRDLVGEFRKATVKHDIRFGVTTHLARSFSWLQTSHGADKTGPMKGVPYDGADPKLASLYHTPFAQSARYPTNPPIAWQRKWYLRVKDLIDSYKPDLMYFDGSYPFDDGAVGRRLVAHYYNINATWHNGKNEAAMCIKKWPAGSQHGTYRDGTCIQDIERGGHHELADFVWQTDTCIGGWYYKEGLRYKTVEHVAHMLIDIVSKNGNLLLNIPLRPDGSIDEQEEAFLKGIGQWMSVCGEALYGTRPWIAYGEGPRKGGGGHFRENAIRYTPRDFRFNIKGKNTLHAFFMAWPKEGKLLVRSLAKNVGAKGRIQAVSLVGHDGRLQFEQTKNGLVVELPGKRPCRHAWALRITGKALGSFKPYEASGLVPADSRGVFTLDADDAKLHGKTPRVEQKQGAGKSNIGHWADPNDYVSWAIDVKKPGRYAVEAVYSCAGAASRFTVTIGKQTITGESKVTGNWARFTTHRLGEFEIPKPGRHTVTVKPKTPPTWKVIGLMTVRLSPTSQTHPVR